MNRRFALAAFITVMLLAACGGGGAATTAPTGAAATPATGTPGAATPPSSTGELPADIQGNVDIHGSSTVAPISNAVAEDIKANNPEFSYVVGEEGTGAGFSEFFCVGNSDISNASRAIRASNPDTEDPEEADICAENGVEYVELKVGYDGIAVITSVSNPIECLTFADLYALLGPESDDVANWNEAEELAQSLGSTTDLPDAPLSITAPGDESGTYDSFIELALNDLIEERFPDDPDSNLHLRTPGAVYVASANDNAIIQGVSGFPTSLGFVGIAYAEHATDTVKMLQVDGGDGCVTPTAETVGDGSYPISRPLFIYPNLGRAAENAAIVSYVDFYLSDEGIANVTDEGYVQMPTDELEASRQAWEDAKP